MTGALGGDASLAFAPQRRAFVSFLFASPATIAGAAIVAIVALCAIFAPLLAPHDPNAQNLASSGGLASLRSSAFRSS